MFSAKHSLPAQCMMLFSQFTCWICTSFQGEAYENRAVFRLAPGKDGTYSIEFNTSISMLQAFFICVIVISSQKTSDLSEEKVYQERTSNGNSGIQMTGPSKYAPNPPHSPVGRV